MRPSELAGYDFQSGQRNSEPQAAFKSTKKSFKNDSVRIDLIDCKITTL